MTTGPDDTSKSWTGRRQEAAEEHAARLHRLQQAETDEARLMLAGFVEAALERALPTVALRARAYNGRSLYRSGLTGWYLRRNGSLAVDVHGDFYLMTAPTNLGSRLRGVTLTPSDPPLVVGKGGRDGESMPLADLLALRLDSTDSWDR